MAHLSSAGLPLAHALPSFGGVTKASDARDCLCALIELVRDLSSIVPDYDCKVVDVFCEFTFSRIMHHSAAAIFNSPIYSENARMINGNALPSWVVDPFRQSVRGLEQAVPGTKSTAQNLSTARDYP
jgi:hypothetical protein